MMAMSDLGLAPAPPCCCLSITSYRADRRSRILRRSTALSLSRPGHSGRNRSGAGKSRPIGLLGEERIEAATFIERLQVVVAAHMNAIDKNLRKCSAAA